MPLSKEQDAQRKRAARARAREARAAAAAAGGPPEAAVDAPKRPRSRARAGAREAGGSAGTAKEPPRTPGVHRKAVTRMLRATGLNHVPEEAPLVEYVKLLADELDRDFNPKTRAQYLSATKDLRRAIGYAGARKPPRTSPDQVETAPTAPSAEEKAAVESPRVSSLAAFKADRGIG